MESPAIVIVAFDRLASLKRLLTGISNAQYPHKNIPLVISIDGGGDPLVISYAKEFEWKFGSKEVICHDENLGLKAHIHECGDLTAKYGSIILFEDDLYPSPVFYPYSQQALGFFSEESSIGGISLYSYQYTEAGFYPFEAIDDGFDNYFLQLPSSWDRPGIRINGISSGPGWVKTIRKITLRDSQLLFRIGQRSPGRRFSPHIWQTLTGILFFPGEPIAQISPMRGRTPDQAPCSRSRWQKPNASSAFQVRMLQARSMTINLNWRLLV